MGVACRFVLLNLLICMTCLLAGGCVGETKSVKESPEAILREAFPDLPFESVQPTDMGGIYEVDSGANVFYFYPEKEYLFIGDIFTTDGKNLTAERKGVIAANMVKRLPLDKAVKTGNGKTVVIEFTDPDCPYCRRAFEFFKKRTDITLYTFFSPLAHPAAISKIYYILNAADRETAYREVFEGKVVEGPKEGYGDPIKQLAREHLNLARSVGITGTPTFFIDGEQVVGFDMPHIEALLESSSGEKTDAAEK